MSACLISITGTSGTIKVNYTIGVDDYSIETSSVGDFYIENTATNVTYTTLEGDLIASSLCLTVTELPSNCYTISWNNINANGYVITDIILGATIIPITSVPFPNSSLALVSSINNLYNNTVKIIGYKLTSESTAYPYDNSYIFKVLGTDVPILRAYHYVTNTYIYFYGIASNCTISGYTQVVPCYTSGIPLTTTTTTTTSTTTTTTTTLPPVPAFCFTWNGTIQTADLTDATGNANPALDGIIFLSYTECPSGNIISQTYSSPQSFTIPCAGPVIDFYYFKNDIRIDITGNITAGAGC